MGTTNYMAPELYEAVVPSLDKADLFSAGVILFDMITGDTPFWTVEDPEYQLLMQDAKSVL
jgi:serine/threonine protein kinase